MGRRRLTDEQLDEMALLRERGWSFGRISEHFADKGLKLSPGAISWQCLRLGADAPPKFRGTCFQHDKPYQRGKHIVRPYTPEDDRILLALEGEGLGDSEIGRRLGRKPNSVRGRLMVLARREARAEETA